MYALAFNSGARPYGRMTQNPPHIDDQKRIGSILKRLREGMALTQGDIGPRLGMTTQGYQKYEKGERRFTAERLSAILKAMDVDRETYDLELAREAGQAPSRARGGVGEQTRSFTFDVVTHARAGVQGPRMYDLGEPVRTLDLRQVLGPNAGALEVAGDSMIPWADPGETILFDRDRHPRRGRGCVIETKTGEFYVKLYEKTDGSTLWVKELFPEERLIDFKMADLAGIYAVQLRGD